MTLTPANIVADWRLSSSTPMDTFNSVFVAEFLIVAELLFVFVDGYTGCFRVLNKGVPVEGHNNISLSGS